MSQKLKFKPSDASRWMTCTASPAATAGVKSERKSYAEEGTIAHELLAICQTLNETPVSYTGSKITVGDLGERDITDEMIDGVAQTIEYINDHIPEGWERFVEWKVDLGWLIPGQKGVIDLAAFKRGACTELHIIDFKFGKGVEVAAEKNPELMLHALGAIRNLLEPAERVSLEKVVLHIAQPRRDHFDRWECTKGELERYAVEVQGKRLEALDADKRKFVPTVEGCRFCPIKHDCRTLKESNIARILDDPNGIGMELKDPDRMTADELAELFPWLDFISAWASNVKEHMVESAKKGAAYPGLKLIKGKGGNRMWKDEKQVATALEQDGHAEFEIYNQRLISPSQYENLVGKKNVSDDIKQLIVTPPAGAKLVPEDQAGTPYKNADDSEFD